ncbi:38863_t:CDS:1, partial [Gigaspora margarita]
DHLPMSPTSLGSICLIGNQSPTSGSSMSLITDMLKRSTLQKEGDPQNKVSSKENKKKSTKLGAISNKQTISESSSEFLTLNDNINILLSQKAYSIRCRRTKA